jgi:hypothetical protein
MGCPFFIYNYNIQEFDFSDILIIIFNDMVYLNH